MVDKMSRGRQFCRGNVLRSPHNGELMIVIDPDNNTLLPIGSVNCTVHPPNQDRYRDEWVYNDDGEEELKQVLESYSIKKYDFVARTIQDLIIDRVKKVIFE